MNTTMGDKLSVYRGIIVQNHKTRE